MPRTPKQTTCRELGCGNAKVNHSYFCIEHGGARALKSTAERKAFNTKYSSKQWKQFRQIQLSKYPLCAECHSIKTGLEKKGEVHDYVAGEIHLIS